MFFCSAQKKKTKSLTTAYNRGLLERAPLRDDLVVCSTTEEINPDLLWFRPAETSLGPRYFHPVSSDTGQASGSHASAFQ
ncbi:unnamed protein product [Caenorhabditis auriculariae]|uniref:Uncharacterized protein n=1 Tax=Caenorhabditis auriculariae TaxID=2777116 RepID=A0A8S1HAG9_9PELO|nr:unnamed protein product [Caenorhabditis auriculariae]